HLPSHTTSLLTYRRLPIATLFPYTTPFRSAHNELTAGQQVQDQFTVTSQDGTATGTVTVTITGTNDAATVSSESKSVTEGDTARAEEHTSELKSPYEVVCRVQLVKKNNAHG